MGETRFWQWTIVISLYISSISLYFTRDNFDLQQVIAIVIFIANTLLAINLLKKSK